MPFDACKSFYIRDLKWSSGGASQPASQPASQRQLASQPAKLRRLYIYTWSLGIPEFLLSSPAGSSQVLLHRAGFPGVLRKAKECLRGPRGPRAPRAPRVPKAPKAPEPQKPQRHQHRVCINILPWLRLKIFFVFFSTVQLQSCRNLASFKRWRASQHVAVSTIST